MRIVFVNRIAWPDEGATAIYLTDVAEAVAAAGHETHVVCGEAPYRAGEGPRGRTRPPSTHRGVRYHRLPGQRGRGLLDRACASLAFHARVAWRLLRLRRPDVIVALTDPPFVDVVASAVTRRRGTRVVHWLMDVYPDVAVAAGVVRGHSVAGRLLAAAMGVTWRRAALVVVLGEGVRRPVLARGVDASRVRVIENWAPAEVEEAARRGRPPRPERPPTLMYSGNYGVAHDLGPLAEGLRALPEAAGLRLVVQASGPRMDELRRALAGLPTPVAWRESVPTARLAESLREADVHVVSVRAGFEDLVVPSKAYAPRALGLPILFVGTAPPAPGADPAPAPARAGLEDAARLGGPGIALVSLPPRPRAAGLREWIEALESVAGPESGGRRGPSRGEQVAHGQVEGAKRRSP